MTKHEQIRSFLQVGLKKYVIKYSDDPREWGFFKDGVLCDVVEIDVTDDEEINWIFRDVTQVSARKLPTLYVMIPVINNCVYI